MTTNTCTGGCHCGNITYAASLSAEAGSYTPRACDCDFCRMHGAAYIADPRGSLAIAVRDKNQLSLYKQGASLAEFLVCANCGVPVAVSYRYDGTIYATINVNTAADRDAFAEVASASPKLLSPEQKTALWRKVWFPNVRVEVAD